LRDTVHRLVVEHMNEPGLDGAYQEQPCSDPSFYAITLPAADRDTRVLVVTGKPLDEPVARGGPFVMNARAAIEQACQDYEQGRF
jgi:hypothetical protein